MSKRKIIILSLVLISLIAVLILVMNLPEKSPKTADETDKIKDSGSFSEAIYTVNVDSITNISFVVALESYTLTKTDSVWSCPEKPNVEISSSGVVSLLASLCSVSYTDSISDTSVTDADCGIDESSDKVTFNSDRGTITLKRGNNVSDSELCYIKASVSDAVYMIKQSTANSIFVSLDSLRNDALQRVDFENIVSIELQNRNCTVSLQKGEYNLDKGYYYSWRMTSPISVFARDEEVNSRLIKPAAAIDVSDYVSDSGDFGNYGLTDKAYYITFTDAKGKAQTIYFSDKINNSYYICVDSDAAIYEVSASDMPFASVSVIDISDRQIYLTKQANLSSVKIEGEGKEYNITFDDNSLISVNGKKTESAKKSSEIFTALCSALADDISTAPMGETVLRFTYTKKDGSVVSIEYANADDRYYFVSKDGTPLYKILKSKINSIFDALEEVK